MPIITVRRANGNNQRPQGMSTSSGAGVAGQRIGQRRERDAAPAGRRVGAPSACIPCQYAPRRPAKTRVRALAAHDAAPPANHRRQQRQHVFGPTVRHAPHDTDRAAQPQPMPDSCSARRRAAGVYVSHVCTVPVKSCSTLSPSVLPTCSLDGDRLLPIQVDHRPTGARPSTRRRSRRTAATARRPFRTPNRQYQQRDGHSEQKREKQVRRDHPHRRRRPPANVCGPAHIRPSRHRMPRRNTV